MPAWFVIAKRELLERVRTKWFIAVTLLGPLAMIGLVVVPALIAKETANEKNRVVVVDLGAPRSPVGAALVAAMNAPAVGWQAELADPGTGADELLHRIKNDQIEGFLIVPASASDVNAKQDSIEYHGSNATNQGTLLKLQVLVSNVVLATRLDRYSPDELGKIMNLPAVDPFHTTGENAGTSGGATFIVGYIVMFVLYMSIILYAVNVMRSVVMEKTNRIVEVMAAAAKPRALMLGKILGVGSAGLLQVAAWAVMAFVVVHWRASILGAFGVSGSGGWDLPAIGADAMVVILAYFLLGYFFYASIYAAIGAMVSSEQEAQQAQTPVLLFLMVPMMCVQLVASNPRGGGAQLLTTLPFSAPILMPMRYLLDGASGGEVAVSLAILTASTALVAWLAGRIYRVGILLYGKRPSLTELARWIRYS